MAIDPTKLIPPTALNWGAQPQPVQPATAAPSLDRSTLEAMAAGPQLDPLVPPAPAGATDTRKASVESASGARQERLAGASERRRALLGGDEAAIEREAAAALNGNETDDLRGLSWSEKLRVKEGVSSEMFDIGERENVDRTTGEVIADTGISLGKGIVQGVGSMATLGGALIDPEAGVELAQANTEFGEWADSFKSDAITERRRIASLRNELDAEENEKEYQANLGKGDQEFVAGLKKIGSDFVDSFSNYTRDGGLVGELTTEGVGSLVVSAGVGGMAMKLVGKGLAKATSEKLAERAVMGGVIGSMEGGDAYGNAALQVMAMDEKTLQTQSPEYVSLRESGMNHEDAQLELAHNSGMSAAAIVVPASALGGALVSKFERMPLAMSGAGIRDVVKTAATQFVEESYQEGVTSWAGNVGLRWSGANPEADLTAGVGESAAMGGIGGAGMGAVIAGPKAAVKAPINAAKLIVDISNKRETAKEEAVSPVSNTAVQNAVVQSNEAATRIQEAVKAAPVVENDPTRAQLDALMSVPEAEVNSLFPNLRPALTGKSRTDGLFSLVQALDDDKLTQTEKDEALLYIKFSLPRVGQVIGGDLRDRVEAMSPGMGNDVDIMADTIGRMVSNPKVAKALGLELSPEQVETLTSVEDTQVAIQNTAMVAEVSPTMLNPVKAREALNHATNGTFRVNPESIRFLAMAADLGDLIQEHKETLDQTFSEVSSENTSRVRDEVFITGRGKQPSMVQHIDRVSNSIRGGQMEQAKAEMEEFRLFAEGQKNKLAAMEASKAKGDGNKVTYGVNTPDGWLPETHERAKAVTYLRGRGAGISELLLQNMRADTKAMERAYARVAKAFPELETKAPEPAVEAPVEAPAGRRQGIKDVQIEAQDEAIQQEAKEEKPYRPRKGTVLPSAVGSLVERDVSQEEAESLKSKIDLHLDDEGKVPRETLSKSELKILRDNYGVKIHHKNVRIPDELAQETLAIRQALEAENAAETVDLGSDERDVSSRDAVQERTESIEEGSEESNRETARPQAATGNDGANESSVSDAVSNKLAADLAAFENDSDKVSFTDGINAYDNIPKTWKVAQAYYEKLKAQEKAQAVQASELLAAVKNTVEVPKGLSKNAGWKLHLNASGQLAEEISARLKEGGVPHKVGKSSGQDGKGITIYAGSRTKADAVASLVDKEFGSRLSSPGQDVLTDDIQFSGNVWGRFDANGDKDFHQYGVKGIPFFDEDMGQLSFADDKEAFKADAIKRADAALKKKYGDFYTGTVVSETAKGNKPEILTGDNGKPVTFYHATKAEFDEFAPGMTFWSSNKNMAFLFGKGKQGDGTLRIVEAQIQAVNPAYVDAGDVAELDVYQNQKAVERDKLFADGHDVVIYFNDRQALAITSKNDQVLQQKPVVQEQTQEIEAPGEMTYWSGIGLYVSIFDGMKAGQLKVEEVYENAGMFQFAYITESGERLAGTFEYNDYELFLDQLVVTSENGANNIGLTQMRNIGMKLLKEFPKAEGISGLRQSGARINDGNDQPVSVVFDLKDGRLVLRKEKQPTEVTPVEEVKPVTLSDVVPNTSEKFRAAYKLREAGSKLLQEKSPVKMIRDAIKARSKGGVVEKVWDALMDDAMNIRVQLNNRLINNPNAVNRLQALAKGEVSKNGNTVLDQAVGRVLNLVQDGKYDPRMAEVAGLAFVHWLVNERKPDRNRIEDSDVASIFKTDVDLVSNDMINIVASGTYIENSVASLAETIQKFAGLDPVSEIARSDAGGIILGLAAETIAAAIEAGYIIVSDKKVDVPKPDGKVESWPYRAVQITDETVLEVQKMIAQSGDISLLEELIVPDADKARYVGKPPEKIDPTQMKNRETELTAKEKKAIKNEQTKPAFVNAPFLRLMNAFGRDNWLDLLGYKPIDGDTKMNVKHRESVEGKNNSLVYGWDGIEGHVAEVDRYAAENGMARDEVPSFWAYGISKVGRLQQRGFGPQGDKQAREVLTATVAVLNLNDQAQDDQFWLTVAQSIGIKTERKTRAKNVAKAKERMSHPLAEKVIGPLFALVQDESATLTNDEIQGIKQAISEITQNKDLGIGEITPKVMHAFLAVARYWNAKENGGAEAFKHNLALESDGKTDGPINAIMNFLSGTFAPVQLMLMSMGGMFVNQKAKTLNSHFAEGGKDLYEHTSGLFENRLLAMRSGMDAKAQAAMDTALRLLSVTGNVTFADGKIKVGRGVVKNPLTVSVYGAGNAGIAGKVTREVMDAVYTRMTESLTGMQDVGDIVDQLATLVNNKIVYSKKKGQYFVFPAEHKSYITKVDAEKFSLNGDQYRQLRDNIKTLFSDPMVDSINEMMGETKRTMSLFQNSTQIQAAVAQEKFRQRVAEIKKDMPVGQDLSDKQYWQVFKEIAPYGAQIYMPDQSANVGVSEKLGAYSPDPNKRSTDMVKSFDDKVSGNLKTLQPSEAGVKAAPFMVIMTGDAQMVLRLASDGLEKTLMVFDGVEMAADLMDSQSLTINKAVLDGWNQDTSSSVADSFENFLRQNPLKDMESFSEATLKSIDRALTGDMNTQLDMDTRKAMIMSLQDSLRQTSDEIIARKKTMKEFAVSVDHMASAEQPYSNDKEIILDENGLPLDGAVLAQKMNEVFESKLSAIKAARNERQTKEKPNAGLVSLVQEGAAAVRGKKGGTVSLSISQMFEAVKTAKNSYQRQMLHAGLSALRSSGYMFHFGTREELVKLRETLSPGIDQALDLGQTDPAGKHVYIASATTETALHEVIHAATIDKVFNALTDPSSVTEPVRQAVDRLNLLMEEFMGYDFKQLDGDKAGIDAQNTIDSHLKKGTEAGRAYAINEFMAWTMANQQLIEVLQKTKVQNPVARLALKVLRTIKGLLGMNAVPDSMFANIRFNTEIILREEMDVESDIQEALNHTVGSNARLSDVMKRFNGLFSHYMNTMATDPAFTKKAKREFKAKNRTDLEIKVKEVTEIFQSAGFNFSDQQAQAFAAIQKAMMTTVEIHTPSLMRAQALYRHVLTNLKPEDFMENPQSTNPNDIKLGQDKFNAFTGAYGFRRDIMGRSSLLGSFIALSQVDPQFRDMLSKIKPPKGDGASPQSSSRFDEIVTGAFNTMSETVASMLYDGAMRKTSVGQTLDNLAMSLTVINQDSRTKVEKAYDSTMNKAEQKLVTLVQSGVDGGIALLQKARSKSKNQITNAMLNAGQSILAMGSERHAQAYADEKTSLFNNEKTPNFIRDLFAEMRGTHSTNENLHNMVGKVKYEVSGNRQDYLEVLPHTILNKFKKKMVPEQWYALSRAIADTDLGNLMGRYSLNRVQELLSDGRKLNGEIASLRARLGKAAPMHAAAYETKANALATYMVTGEITSKNLLTNAIAISRLLGERGAPSQVPAQEIVDMIDDLTSLMAIQKTQKADRDVLLDKLQNERDGMDFMLRYLHELDRREKTKTTNMRGLFNHIKGQVDTVRTGSDHVIVADDTDFKKLTRMGYVRMGDYQGDKNDPGLRGYYYSSVTGQSTYHQGVMQTVQQTVYGVDAMTGYMIGNPGGRINGAAAKRIKADLFKQKKDNLPPGEYLKPVYDETGNAVAFERMLAPAMLAKAKKDDHLATRIGTWRGRQAEEAHSTQYNSQLVSVLKEYWHDQKADHEKEFINLADPKQRDRVTDHIWTVIPKEMKQEIEYAFGMDEDGKPRFMVRRDMLNDALGYPGASIGDVFTGNNRLPQSVNEASRNFLTAVMGTKAYPWLIQTEQLWQSAVSAAKTTMVIRSVVIPLANIVSNAFQLLLRRVPLRYFGKPLMHKVAETNTFLRNKVRLAELEAEGIAARGDIQRTATLRAKYRAIEDENKRLSIWPLIERGEFATISDGLSEADKVVDNHKIMDMIEAQVNKMPEGVRTVGKYAIVSRDTALFKLLNRSVQYGDFIAKALLYEHNLAQGLTPEDAYRAIRNEFVNYNLLPGRLRTALEGMGLLWFYNFKIRSMKTALSVIRNNPLSALLWSLSPVRDIPINGFGDSVLTDNLIAKGLEDKLHHSMGPGMVTMIYESNPWIRFMNS